MSEAQFESWPKIPRHGKGGVIITEKLDGTNAQVNIVRAADVPDTSLKAMALHTFSDGTDVYSIFAGSRKRYITPDDDNFGFARWVVENSKDLESLGHGRHFGEWYGMGIQRTYGLAEKRFALFNTARWNPDNPTRPECCEVVPVLYAGELRSDTVDNAMYDLMMYGSTAVPEWDKPEGIVTYNTMTRHLTKLTFEHERGKWADKGE